MNSADYIVTASPQDIKSQCIQELNKNNSV